MVSTLALTYPYPHADPPVSVLRHLRTMYSAEARTLGLVPLTSPRFEAIPRAGGSVLTLAARCREAITEAPPVGTR